MTAKQRQKNFRFSDLTARQLEALAAAWGETETRVIERLIDRVYQKENAMNEQTYIFDTIEEAQREAAQQIAAMTATMERHSVVIEASTLGCVAHVSAEAQNDPVWVVRVNTQHLLKHSPALLKLNTMHID